MWTWLNQQAGWLFLAGLAAVLLWNLVLWRRDQALARRLREQRPPPPSLPQDGPPVSVLAAAWNEADMIQEHVESFQQLGYAKRELVLCAGGEDGTLALAQQYAGEQVVVLEQQAGEGKQAALRRCLERARGEVVFLTDADCLLDDESFERTLAPVLLEGAEVTTGSYQPLDAQIDNPFVVHQWCADLAAAARMEDPVRSIVGRNCALRRQVLDAVGGFEPPLRTGTDYYMGKMLAASGYRIRYRRDSEVRTRYPTRLRSYWRKQSRWVRNLVLHGPAFAAYEEVWMALRTSLVGLTMLLLPLVALAAGPLVLVAWGLLFGHSFLSKLRYAGLARLYRGARVSARQLLLTPAYMIADFVAWALPLFDLAARRDRW
ncbi:MAG: glycosyltransferase [Anaerolineae bacterium]|nr:glycosyltransferase [Anaerolineae bacterium]